MRLITWGKNANGPVGKMLDQGYHFGNILGSCWIARILGTYWVAPNFAQSKSEGQDSGTIWICRD